MACHLIETPGTSTPQATQRHIRCTGCFMRAGSCGTCSATADLPGQLLASHNNAGAARLRVRAVAVSTLLDASCGHASCWATTSELLLSWPAELCGHAYGLFQLSFDSTCTGGQNEWQAWLSIADTLACSRRLPSCARAQHDVSKSAHLRLWCRCPIMCTQWASQAAAIATLCSRVALLFEHGGDVTASWVYDSGPNRHRLRVCVCVAHVFTDEVGVRQVLQVAARQPDRPFADDKGSHKAAAVLLARPGCKARRRSCAPMRF